MRRTLRNTVLSLVQREERQRRRSSGWWLYERRRSPPGQATDREPHPDKSRLSPDERFATEMVEYLGIARIAEIQLVSPEEVRRRLRWAHTRLTAPHGSIPPHIGLVPRSLVGASHEERVHFGRTLHDTGWPWAEATAEFGLRPSVLRDCVRRART